MKKLILSLALGVLAIGLQAGDQGNTNPKATCPTKDKACCSQKADSTKATATACPMKQASCCSDKQMTGVKNQTTAKVAMSPKAATEARK